MKLLKLVPALCLALVAAGCGGEETGTSRQADGAASAPDVELTGTVVEVKMISGPGGELFDPAELTVRRGDVVRFVLQSGVHNASFPADRNPDGVRLPGPTPMMQLPGQTDDIAIDLPPGRYYFQCDPHVMLGMIGHINVAE